MDREIPALTMSDQNVQQLFPATHAAMTVHIRYAAGTRSTCGVLARSEDARQSVLPQTIRDRRGRADAAVRQLVGRDQGLEG